MKKETRPYKVDLGFYYGDHYFALHPDGSVEVCDANEIDFETMKFLLREAKAFIEYCNKRKYPKARERT